jgi:glycosyltransferase involved in cell wall biosynthesis
MRVVFLNTSDSGGGAARAAVRLLHGVREAGVDAQMIVQRKLTDDNAVVGPGGRFGNDLTAIRTHLDCAPLGLYPKRNRFIFSPAFLPEKLQHKVDLTKPDIIHLHWLGEGFLRLESLARFEQPLVWTLHDSWAFTGGCHIPFDCINYREKCGYCPALGSSRQRDLSRWVWRRKERIFRKLNLTVVAPSSWLARCAKSSPLLHRFPIEVIPNGLDLGRFRPLDKLLARQIFGLPQDKKLILFGAMSCTSDKNKGFHLLQPAMQKLVAKGWKNNVELVVFGSTEPANAPDFGLKTHYLGRMHDDTSIALLYSAADLFVAPSIQENLSNTVMEAMACGTPCVAFDIGGMPDLIEHEHNGYLAHPFEAEDLAEGIAWGLADEERSHALSSRCREKVAQFSLGRVAGRYIDLYKKLLIT